MGKCELTRYLANIMKLLLLLKGDNVLWLCFLKIPYLLEINAKIFTNKIWNFVSVTWGGVAVGDIDET